MKRRLVALGAAAAFAVAGCEHKDLCYLHPHKAEVHVVFDWAYAPEAEEQQEVEGMCLWFYPVDGEGKQAGEPLRYDLAGMKGGRIDLPVGRYNVLYYNNDYETVQFRNVEAFWQQECYTRESHPLEPIYGNTANYAPRAKESEGETVVSTPEMMWGDNAMHLEVTQSGLGYWFVRDGETEPTTITSDEMRFTLMPHEQVCSYSYEIRNVENLGHVSQMCATLSGMAGSVFCAAEALTEENVTLPFGARADGASTIRGEFGTFGHHGDNDERHKLLLYVWMSDGSKWYYTFDVTEQVDNAPDRRHVHIVIDGLELPQPIGNGSGFHPEVDDWETVEEDIVM